MKSVPECADSGGNGWGLCSSQELKFLEAQGAYAKGKPIMSDEEFDDMKRQLKLRDSRICAQVRAMSSIFTWPLQSLACDQVVAHPSLLP
jgi:hypothetical protein